MFTAILQLVLHAILIVLFGSVLGIVLIESARCAAGYGSPRRSRLIVLGALSIAIVMCFSAIIFNNSRISEIVKQQHDALRQPTARN